MARLEPEEQEARIITQCPVCFMRLFIGARLPYP